METAACSSLKVVTAYVHVAGGVVDMCVCVCVQTRHPLEVIYSCVSGTCKKSVACLALLQSNGACCHLL